MKGIPTITFLLVCMFLLSCSETYHPLTSIKDDVKGHQETFVINDKEKDIITHSNEFALNIFKRIVDNNPTHSTFCATQGLIYTLNIINNGATGQTRTALCKSLGYSENDLGFINDLCHRMMLGQMMSVPDDFDRLANDYMKTACLLISTPSLQVKKDYEEEMANSYYADVIHCPVYRMQSIVNQWCKAQTDKTIKSIPCDFIDEMDMTFLTSSVFNGTWVQRFDPTMTMDEPFTMADGKQEKVAMMNQEDHELFYQYAKREHYSVLRMPYCGQFHLLVLLPEKGVSTQNILQTLHTDSLESIDKELDTYEIFKIKLPRFKTQTTIDYRNYLEEMGLGRMFSENAEFANISSPEPSPIALKEIRQQNEINMDENGTWVKSAMASYMFSLAAYEKPRIIEFYADHPFIYLIRDRFGNICFMGQYCGN